MLRRAVKAALYYIRKRDWTARRADPHGIFTLSTPVDFSTAVNTVKSINLATLVTPDEKEASGLRLKYVDGTLTYVGNPGIAVQGGVVTWVAPNIVFTPTTDYTGAISFKFVVGNGLRQYGATANGSVA